MFDERTSPLFERMYMFLNDKNWLKADEYCEKILDIEPKNAEAYLGKLMAARKVCEKAAVSDCSKPLDFDPNYNKIISYGDKDITDFIIAANESTKTNYYRQKEKNRKFIKISLAIFIPVIAIVTAVSIVLTTVIIPAKTSTDMYEKALRCIEKEKYFEAIELLTELGDYKDSEEKLKEVRYKIAPRDTIAAGLMHTVALKSDGTVVIADKGYEEKFDDTFTAVRTYDISNFNDIIAVAAGYSHTVGLKSDGTVIAEFHNNVDYAGQCEVDDWKNIISVSAGSLHTVGLKSNGTVVATKYYAGDYRGQCDVEDWENIVAIAAGRCQTIGLKADGTVISTKYIKEDNFAGGEDNGQFEVDDWKNIIAISAGTNHCVGLKSDGTVVTAGANYYGQCDVESWRDIVAISAGEDHTVGLKSDGTVVSTQYKGDSVFYNGFSDVGYWSDIVAISAGRNHTIGLKSDGTVVATNYIGAEENYRGQCDVADFPIIRLPDNYK